MKEPETGKKENTGKSGYSITTWRLHLWCRHPEWLRTTQEFYNRIAEFYYNLLLDHTELWELGSQQTLRELEIMSIPGRSGRIPSDPLPWQKVPLYFRRAAANSVDIIVVDNSTKDFNNEKETKANNWTYLSMNGNAGLSKAYNRALDYLKDEDGIVIWFDDGLCKTLVLK